MNIERQVGRKEGKVILFGGCTVDLQKSAQLAKGSRVAVHMQIRINSHRGVTAILVLIYFYHQSIF